MTTYPFIFLFIISIGKDLFDWKIYDNIIWTFLELLIRVTLIFYYQKMWEIYILKNLVCKFWYFQAFFFKPWSRGKHSWLWICSPGFKSRPGPRFSNFFSFVAITLTNYWWTMNLSLQKVFFEGLSNYRK